MSNNLGMAKQIVYLLNAMGTHPSDKRRVVRVADKIQPGWKPWLKEEEVHHLSNLSEGYAHIFYENERWFVAL